MSNILRRYGKICVLVVYVGVQLFWLGWSGQIDQLGKIGQDLNKKKIINPSFFVFFVGQMTIFFIFHICIPKIRFLVCLEVSVVSGVGGPTNYFVSPNSS